MFTRLAVVCALLIAPLPVFAQQQETLADIRQQLTMLFSDVQRLKRELSTTGQLSAGVAGNTPLDRLNAIEAELQRLTSNTEQLEFRVNSITTEANNRIGDLNFRLCELETNCDIGQLDDTPLGGVQTPAVAAPVAPATGGGPALAVGEQSDFERVQGAFAAGDYRAAADQATAFLAAYPGSPLSADVNFLRGEALEDLGETTNAARAYLDAFSGAPTGPRAPASLFKLGASLGQIGQTQDACLTLAEVNVRFPGDPMTSDAAAEMQALGCM